MLLLNACNGSYFTLYDKNKLVLKLGSYYAEIPFYECSRSMVRQKWLDYICPELRCIMICYIMQIQNFLVKMLRESNMHMKL